MSQIETINKSFVYLVLPQVSTNKFGEAKYVTNKDTKSNVFKRSSKKFPF
jgi:hypothetical protein